MAVLNDTIFGNKKVFGLGKASFKIFRKQAGLNTRVNSNSFKFEHQKKAFSFLEACSVDKNLKKLIRENIHFLKEIKSFRGERHKKKYPCRGQRTHTNAKTVKKFR